MKVFLIAGERSGDLHGSNLAKELLRAHENLKLIGVGGDLMKAQGVDVKIDYRDISFMGFFEVIKNLFTIQKALKKCKLLIAHEKPDLLVMIDFPGFNLRMAKHAKDLGIPTCYYISPKIWAWKESRIKKIKEYVDRMLLILPFEEDFYEKHHYDKAVYVGNPLNDSIRDYSIDSSIVNNLKCGARTIAFLPGSRFQEVKASLDIAITIAQERPDWVFHVAAVNNLSRDLYALLDQEQNIHLHYDKAYELLSSSDAAVVTSGTATLETALLEVPQVVVYKTSWLTYTLAKWFVNIQFISLVNLIAEKEVVKELIQGDYNPRRVLKELERLLIDSKPVLDGYEDIKKRIGNSNASLNASNQVLDMLNLKQP